MSQNLIERRTERGERSAGRGVRSQDGALTHPAFLSCAVRHMSSVMMGQSFPGRDSRRFPLEGLTAREI